MLRLALAEKTQTKKLSCAIRTDRSESDVCFPHMGQYDIPAQAKKMGNWHGDLMLEVVAVAEMG